MMFSTHNTNYLIDFKDWAKKRLVFFGFWAVQVFKDILC